MIEFTIGQYALIVIGFLTVPQMIFGSLFQLVHFKITSTWQDGFNWHRNPLAMAYWIGWIIVIALGFIVFMVSALMGKI